MLAVSLKHLYRYFIRYVCVQIEKYLSTCINVIKALLKYYLDHDIINVIVNVIVIWLFFRLSRNRFYF